MKTLTAWLLLIGLAVQGIGEEQIGGSRTPVALQKHVALAPPSLAEQGLFRLSERMRQRRRIRGTIGFLAGSALAAGGIVMVARDEDEDYMGLGEFFGALMIVEGGLGLVGGAISLVLPSRAEKAGARISSIADPADRERAAEKALAGLAKKGRRARMIRGGLVAAAGIATMLGSDEDGQSDRMLMAAFIGCLATYSFLSKSLEKKAYRSYLEKRGSGTAPELVLGLRPGGVRVAVIITF
jgi:hypothetical protein